VALSAIHTELTLVHVPVTPGAGILHPAEIERSVTRSAGNRRVPSVESKAEAGVFEVRTEPGRTPTVRGVAVDAGQTENTMRTVGALGLRSQ
jgi:predicted transcriptional regulator